MAAIVEAVLSKSELQQIGWMFAALGDDPLHCLRAMGRILRRVRSLLLLAELLADDADTIPLPSAPDVEVAPMVDQLVGSLSAAPASPPGRRAALAAA